MSMTKKPYDFARRETEAKNFRHFQQHFWLNPKQLRGCSLPTQLTWYRVPFRAKQLGTIINRPGVYAFSVTQDGCGLPPHGYVLYVGQTGAKKKAPHRTLRQRAREYFREKKTGSRPHIALFLRKWSKCLYFYYAQLDPAAVNLLDVEMKLNDALIPPYSVEDFSPKIRRLKRITEKQ
jgi:hypothetical protein